MSQSQKRAVVLVENNYQEMEVWYPYYRLQEAGLEVVAAGREAGKTYTSKLGYPIVAAQTIASLNAAMFDVLVVPGGYAPDYLRSYPEVLRFVRDMDAAGKVVSAICHAGWVLCSAGILKGRHATSFINIKDDMVNAGAIWEDSEVVVDKNLVTSRKPADLPAFMRAILTLAHKD
jgi:protease I